jgi:hypothetical protein
MTRVEDVCRASVSAPKMFGVRRNALQFQRLVQILDQIFGVLQAH